MYDLNGKMMKHGILQSGAPVDDSVQLVQITPISLWFMVTITIVFMGFINHLITVGPHIVVIGGGLLPSGCGLFIRTWH